MELIRGWHNLRPRHRGCVATIGNFDGVHLGHRAVVEQLARQAARSGVPGTVIIFEPQPLEHFQGAGCPPRITRLREKLEALATLAVDRILLLRFRDALAGTSAERFVDDLLVGRLGVRALVVGDDFRFGRGGAGDFALLEHAATRDGFALVQRHTYQLDGARVSSSRVRAALAEGRLADAARLLGRPYALTGRVVHGDALGRTLGFATANVPLGPVARPVAGVFAVWVHGAGAAPRPGVANVGTRPTVGGTRRQLEVHLLDFDGDLYGRRLHVELAAKLRDERRFESLEALKAQLGLDLASARAALDGACAPGAPR